MNSSVLPDAALNQLFVQAHTVHAFTAEPVSEETLQGLYDLLKWAPTAFNAQPARFVFVKSAQAKARLAPALSPNNVPQVNGAAVTVIVAHDSQFHEHLPRLFPAYDAKPLFDSNEALREATAFRNGSLQGAYLMMAARALGLDVGAMSGFDAAKVNAEFFPDGRWRANFLVNIGVADPSGIYPRGPRLSFDEATQVL